MNIAQSDWQEASGSYVQDELGRLWRIIGFIDKPAVILEPVKLAELHTDNRQRQTVIMGSPVSGEYRRLVPEAPQVRHGG